MLVGCAGAHVRDAQELLNVTSEFIEKFLVFVARSQKSKACTYNLSKFFIHAFDRRPTRKEKIFISKVLHLLGIVTSMAGIAGFQKPEEYSYIFTKERWVAVVDIEKLARPTTAYAGTLLDVAGATSGI